MDKILRGVSDERVWLKSLDEHDNVDKFVQLTCSVRYFNRTLSSQTPFILHHKNTVCHLCSTEKRHTVKGYSFRVKWGMADIVDPLLKMGQNMHILFHKGMQSPVKQYGYESYMLRYSRLGNERSLELSNCHPCCFFWKLEYPCEMRFPGSMGAHLNNII